MATKPRKRTAPPDRSDAPSAPPAPPAELQRAAQVQEAIYRISEAALRARTLEELLRAVHESVSGLMPARNFYVALADEAAGLLTFPYFADEYDADFGPRPLGRGLTEYVLRTGRPLLATPEVHEELMRRGEADLVGVQSIDWVGVPLTVRDRTIGVIAAQSYSAGVRYGEDEKNILTFVSEQVAMAIERRRAEDALRESEERLRLVQLATNDAVWDLDLLTQRLWWSENFQTLFGYAAGDLGAGVDFWSERIHPEDRERVVQSSDAVVYGSGTIWAEEYRFRRGDGGYAYVYDRGYVIRDAHGTPVRFIGTLMDVTARRRAEEALRQSEERYRAFIGQSTEGIWRFELEPPLPIDLAEDEQIAHFYERAYLAECNDAFARMYGRTAAAELVGARPNQFLDPEDPQNTSAFRAFIRAGYRLTDGETHERDAEGRPKVFLNNYVGIVEGGRLLRIWGMQRDVTEQRHLEAQLRQAQKMEAVGRLAGGVAHDFNNILTSVLGTCSLLLRDLRDRSQSREDVEEIRRAAQRAAGLTRQLLAYSRRQVLQPEPLDLNALVRDLEKMLRRLIGEDVELVTTLAPDLEPVRADPSQLEQVVMNLVVNARDAMPQGGRLTIETANARLDGSLAGGPAGAPAGPCVMLAIKDTGIGMDEAVRAHLFEPFFTTKEVGKGTGLGLATVYGIVKQSGGHIAVDTAPGRGATFRIYLPRAEAGVGQRPPLPPLGPPPVGTETVLLAEDEPAVRELGRRALEACGYTVLAASGGPEALRLAADRDDVALLLTDVVMPGMSGPELAARLRGGRPRLKVLYVSGYTDHDVVRREAARPGTSYLQKPFDPQMLARKVREVLDT